MNAWEHFFETIIYINLPHRTDSNVRILEQFYIHDIPYFKRMDGIIDPDSPMKGFNQAQWNAINASKGNTVIFEDDVVFDRNSGHLLQALDELPVDWDILYLGANVVGTDLCSWPEPQHYSTHLRRVTQAWTTHAVCYSQKGLDWIKQNWKHDDGQMYDDFLRCNLEKLQAFIIFPMICNQRPGYSDIWQREVDYGFFNVWRQIK